MKKLAYILSIALLGFFAASCEVQEGTVPGSDGKPQVTIFQYTPSSEYNSDEDIKIRFVKNKQTTSAKFLVELTKDKAAAIETDGEKAYIEKVLSTGTDIDFTDEGIADTLFTGLANFYDITVVAINSGKKELCSSTFEGLAWKSGLAGTYYLGAATIQSVAGTTSLATELQQCESDSTLYRFKDLFGPGKSIKIKLTDDDPFEDPGYGYCNNFRVKRQATCYSYGSFGQLDIIDFGYSLGDDYFYDGGYNCYMYQDDKYCVLQVRYIIPDGRALANAYGDSADIFVAD